MKRRELLTTLAGSAAALTLGSRLSAQQPAMQPTQANGAARPNILWLMIEDTSTHEFPAYGNPNSKTPVINDLAARGVLFERAWASAPECSPSRSSIITGSQATTWGTDRHRSKVPIPDDVYFPQLMREAGYYCTNNAKTDYNITGDPRAIWDQSGGGNNTSYNSPRRKPGQPFYAVFNSDVTHMGRLRSFDLKGRRDFAAEGLDPAKLQLPNYLPDLPEVRSDYALHMEGVQDIDVWVGFFLKDLKAKGLDEDTIIIFAADHGGSAPRSKGYVYETGLRVPLIVYVPPKFRHLSRFAPGTRSDRLVGLVDLAPTILSLAGVKPPARMQAKAFLGQYEAAPRPYLFAFTTNQGGHYQPERAVTDGRFKLFRSYTPHKPLALRNTYQWGMPANLAWDEYALDGRGAKGKAALMLPFHPHKGDRLYDLEADPYEINDLSALPQHAATLAKLGAALDTQIRDTADLGLFSLVERGHPGGLYAWTRATNYPLAALHEAALVASKGDAKNVGKLTGYLRSDKPEIRFWGASGFATLGAVPATNQKWTPPQELFDAVNDKDASVAAEAAHALCYAGKMEVGLPALVDMFANGSVSAQSALETLSLTTPGRAAMRPYVPRLQKMAGIAADEAAPQEGAAPKGKGKGKAAAQGGDGEGGGEGGNKSGQARSILINLRELPVKDLFGAPERAKGLAVNTIRRPLVPVP